MANEENDKIDEIITLAAKDVDPVMDLIKEIRHIRKKERIRSDEPLNITLEANTLQETQELYRMKEFIEATMNCRLFFVEDKE